MAKMSKKLIGGIGAAVVIVGGTVLSKLLFDKKCEEPETEEQVSEEVEETVEEEIPLDEE